MTKNKENWQNLNRLLKFSEIWYVDAYQQRKCYKKTIFRILHLLALFGQKTVKKQQKFTKNEENLQNSIRLMKFSEIWYVDASQQKKCYKNIFFGFRPFLAVFKPKKLTKLTKNKLKTGKIQTVR